MTIAADDALSSGPYTGNGATTVFDYDFTVFAATEVKVIRQTIATLAEETLVLGVDYTVNPAGGVYPNPGTITMTVAPTAAQKIVIQPDISPSQDRPYSTQGSVSLTELEASYDKLTMLVRQLIERADRAITISAFSDIADLDQLRADIESIGAQLDAGNIALLDATNVFTKANVFADNSGLLTLMQFRARSADAIHDLSFRDNAGNTAWRWDIRTQSTSSGSTQFRHNGVPLATLASTGNLTLAGTSGAFISGVGGVISSSEVQVRTDLNPSVGFRAAAGTVHALIYLNRAAANADRPGRVSVNLYDPDGSNARVVAIFPDTIAEGDSLFATNYLVTREHGDVRYVQPVNTVQIPTPTNLFTGDVNTILTTSYYVADTATATNVPINGGFAGLRTWMSVNTNAAVQEMQYFSGGALYRRTRVSGTWGAWSLVGASTPNVWQNLAEQAASGTAVNFTSIPAGVREVDVMFEGVSLTGTDYSLVQLGDSGGLETTGYVSSVEGASVVTATNGLIFAGGSAAADYSGIMKLRRVRDTNRWLADGLYRVNGVSGSIIRAQGSKTLSADLDRLTITRTGTNTFDAGTFNLEYRY